MVIRIDNKDVLYKCLICGEQEIVKAWDHRRDGRSCRKCRGHLQPMGYIGLDLGKGKDVTVYTPGSKKMKKL